MTLKVPQWIAKAILLRQAPRTFRVAFAPADRAARERDMLAADIEAIAPDLAGLARRWAEDVGAGEPVGVMEPLVAGLDAVAPVREAARSLADALLLASAAPADLPWATRMASALWRDLQRTPELGATIHQLALGAATLQLDPLAELPDDPEDPDALADLPNPSDEPTESSAQHAWRKALGAAFDALKQDAATAALGLVSLEVAPRSQPYNAETLLEWGLRIGRTLVRPIQSHAFGEAARRHRARPAERPRTKPASAPEAAVAERPADGRTHVVCGGMGFDSPRVSGLAKTLQFGFGPLPVAPRPDIDQCRAVLRAEFPHLAGAVDAILSRCAADAAHIPPMLLVGPPGCGKSTLARRIAELLGVGGYRVDGSGDGGTSFGGTERRWYSSEPSRPFLAVVRHRIANPMLIIDEVDKAPTRADYGRLWDALLPFLETETAVRYVDPCLQVETDLSLVSVMLTANATSHLPGPLLDRVAPQPQHLESLAGAMVRLAAERDGVDPRLLALGPSDLAFLGRVWRGGSLRRLSRAVDALLARLGAWPGDILN